MDKLYFISAVSVLTVVIGVLIMVIRSALSRSKTVKILRHEEWNRPHKKMNHNVVATLPPPVQRYLENVIKDGVEQIRFATVRQLGEWRSLSQPQWGRLKAESYYSGTAPGFVWHARIRSSKIFWTTAQLLYGSGHSEGYVRLLGIITMFDPHGPEVASALLSRILMEAVWFPTSLIPSGALRWEAIDENSARALLSDKGKTISSVFYFNSRNEVERIVTRDKFRDAETSFERDQCTMYCSDYKSFSGISIPTTVRIEWNLQEGDFEYARITVQHAFFE
jgi:hypothetical protein